MEEGEMLIQFVVPPNEYENGVTDTDVCGIRRTNGITEVDVMDVHENGNNTYEGEARVIYDTNSVGDPWDLKQSIVKRMRRKGCSVDIDINT